MHSSPTFFPKGVGLRSLSWMCREVYIYWQFNRYDISSAVIPGLLFSLAAWHSTYTLKNLGEALACGISYFFLYSHVFCISNQIAGLNEDRLNKPDRPLVRGIISLRGAWVRWAIAMLLFVLLGWWLRVLEWALLWQLVLVLHNQAAWAKHWCTKNLAMGLGIMAQLAAGWQMVAPLIPQAWVWIIFPALVMLTHVSIQDLRDMAGDRVVGRRTFPLIFGEKFSRYFLAIGFMLLPLATYQVLIVPAGLGGHTLACYLLMATLNVVIAVRVLCMQSPQADHRSYMLFTYWYCLIPMSAIIIL